MQTETLFNELSSAILYRSQNTLPGTGDTCSFDHLRMKDFWLSIADHSSAAKKKKYHSVSLKTFRRWSFSDDFVVESDAKGHCSEHMLLSGGNLYKTPQFI